MNKGFMIKNALLLLFFLVTAHTIYAKDNFKLYFSFAQLSGNYSFSEDMFFEGSVQLGLCYLEHRSSHFGLIYELVKTSIYYNDDSDKTFNCWYFFNPTIYYNLFRKRNNIFGPFISAHYAAWYNPFAKTNDEFNLYEYKKNKWRFDQYILNAGLMILWQPTWNLKYLPFWKLGAESGLALQPDKTGFYINFSVNFFID
jgi:hypothetical protein